MMMCQIPLNLDQWNPHQEITSVPRPNSCWVVALPAVQSIFDTSKHGISVVHQVAVMLQTMGYNWMITWIIDVEVWLIKIIGSHSITKLYWITQFCIDLLSVAGSISGGVPWHKQNERNKSTKWWYNPSPYDVVALKLEKMLKKTHDSKHADGQTWHIYGWLLSLHHRNTWAPVKILYMWLVAIVIVIAFGGAYRFPGFVDISIFEIQHEAKSQS